MHVDENGNPDEWPLIIPPIIQKNEKITFAINHVCDLFPQLLKSRLSLSIIALYVLFSDIYDAKAEFPNDADGGFTYVAIFKAVNYPDS